MKSSVSAEAFGEWSGASVDKFDKRTASGFLSGFWAAHIPQDVGNPVMACSSMLWGQLKSLKRTPFHRVTKHSVGDGFTVVHQFPSDQARSESRASRGSPIATVQQSGPQNDRNLPKRLKRRKTAHELWNQFDGKLNLPGLRANLWLEMCSRVADIRLTSKTATTWPCGS